MFIHVYLHTPWEDVYEHLYDTRDWNLCELLKTNNQYRKHILKQKISLNIFIYKDYITIYIYYTKYVFTCIFIYSLRTCIRASLRHKRLKPLRTPYITFITPAWQQQRAAAHERWCFVTVIREIFRKGIRESIRKGVCNGVRKRNIEHTLFLNANYVKEKKKSKCINVNNI